jgi:YVTN family beta-propeller protein
MRPSAALGPRRIPRAVLRIAAVVSMLAGTALVVAPAASAAGSTYATTELPFCCQGVVGVAADPATDTVYAGASGGVAIIDGATDTVIAQNQVPDDAAVVAVDQASDTVYAIGPGTQAVAHVINGATDAITAAISLPSGLDSLSAAANPVTHMIYVTDYIHSTVVVIDGNTDTVAATIPLADPALAPDPFLFGVAVDSATNTVYVSDARDDQVAVIDGATNTVTNRIALPASSAPTGLAADPSAGLVYTADAGTGAVSVIDATTDSVSTLASGMTDPEGLALDAGSETLYASDPGSATDPGTTYVIDTAGGTITGQIPRGGLSVAVPASGGSVFVGRNGGRLSDDLTVITPSSVPTMSPVIVGTTTFTFTAGQAGQGQVTASATPAATFTETGTLPAGVTFSPSGLFAGTPATGTGGVYSATVTAANGIAPSFSWDITLNVDEPPSITSADQVGFFTGVASNFDATAAGSPPPAFSETGALPAGITFSTSGPVGVLSGTPAAGTAGVYAIQFTASNLAGTATQAFTLIVNPAVAPVFTSADQVVFGTGVAGSFTVTATGSPAPTFSETGALPEGVTLTSTGALSGAPTVGTGGRYPITITASNAGGSATQTFTLIVDVPGAPPPAGGQLGDVTGDGLSDILAIDGSGNLWLYPNTGSGDAGMFAGGRSQVGQGWIGYTLATVVPLPGSARAGILATDSAGNLWYYPNTGGTGFGTFGTRSKVGTGWNGYTVVGVADLYGLPGEGLPGLVAIDPAGNLWYYSCTGGTGTATFGGRTLVGTGWTGYTADLNGDALPGILAVDSSGTMWLYPNVEGYGTSSFGSPVEISTGRAGYQAIDVGVLTSGTPTVLGIDPAGNLWYYPSTNGTFGTPVQVGTGWTGYRIN